MTKEEEINFSRNLRKRILESIDDLKNKIERNEPCPENEQDLHLLMGIDDRLEECLNNWYY
jgi:hypothetical protein